MGDLLSALTGPHWLAYLGVIVPMGVFNVVGSLQNIESAEAAGDSYETAPCLAVNGMGTVAASLFGSCFPTTIYIGHPGWKAMGARAGYSTLNAAFFSVIALSGTLAHIAWAGPVEAGMAVVLWIGRGITAQAFEAVPRKHAPAVVLGLLPGVAAWGALMAKNGRRAGGYGSPGGPPFSDELISAFQRSDTFITGAFALEQGFIFTAMILSAITVCIIERQLDSAAYWAWAASALAALGFIHAHRYTPGDVVMSWDLNTITAGATLPWAWGYALMGAVFFSARWLTVSDEPSAADDPPD